MCVYMYISLWEYVQMHGPECAHRGQKRAWGIPLLSHFISFFEAGSFHDPGAHPFSGWLCLSELALQTFVGSLGLICGHWTLVRWLQTTLSHCDIVSGSVLFIFSINVGIGGEFLLGPLILMACLMKASLLCG